jgi:N,N-dimethylformamidase beta subunit-like, C-terminal
MLPLLLALSLSTAVENQKPGTPDWELTDPALSREIEGYASKTSVNGGEPIELFVHTTGARYTIDVFRVGWYGGAGARRVAAPIDRPGVAQDVPAPDPATGLVECAWRDPYRLDTADGDGAWTSGVYLARLTARPSGKQSFIVFVVRDDARESAMVFQSSVTTFAAYNNWGGKSLYGFNSGDAPARKVSFDRPYATNPYGVRLDGAGDFLRRWEYNAVRFLEREGYDVSYLTDVDTHQRPVVDPARRGPLLFLSVGHDEYWSWDMRRHVEAARDHGVHLVFLGAGACYWKIRFERSARGDADRTIVGYKEVAGDLDPLAVDGDPKNDRLITGRWRDRPAERPEEQLVGVMYAADPVDADIIVSDASHWVFAGTGLGNGDALRGLLGYEVDAIYGDGPATLERLAHSPFVEQGTSRGVARTTRFSDMTIYTADSGALVFATGSIQWSWGLDGYNAPGWHTLRVSEAAQQITRTVLARMLLGPAAPRRPNTPSSSTIVVIAALVAAAFVLRAWLSRPKHRASR